MFQLIQQIDVDFIWGGIALLAGAFFLFRLFYYGKPDVKKDTAIVFICAVVGIVFLMVGQFNIDYVSVFNNKLQYEALKYGIPICHKMAENDSNIAPLLDNGAQLVFRDAEFTQVCCSDGIHDGANLHFDIIEKNQSSKTFSVQFYFDNIDINSGEFELRTSNDKGLIRKHIKLAE